MSIMADLARIPRLLEPNNIREVRAKLPNSSRGYLRGPSLTILPQLKQPIKEKMEMSFSQSIRKLLINLLAATTTKEKGISQMINSFRKAISQINRLAALTTMWCPRKCPLTSDLNPISIKSQVAISSNKMAMIKTSNFRIKINWQSRVSLKQETPTMQPGQTPYKSNLLSNRTTKSTSGIRIKIPRIHRQLRNHKNQSIQRTWLHCLTTRAIRNRCTPMQ